MRRPARPGELTARGVPPDPSPPADPPAPSSSTRPAGVKVTPEWRRSNRGAPASRSNAAACRDMPDWVYPNASAAVLKLPPSATASNKRNDTVERSMTDSHNKHAEFALPAWCIPG